MSELNTLHLSGTNAPLEENKAVLPFFKRIDRTPWAINSRLFQIKIIPVRLFAIIPVRLSRTSLSRRNGAKGGVRKGRPAHLRSGRTKGGKTPSSVSPP